MLDYGWSIQQSTKLNHEKNSSNDEEEKVWNNGLSFLKENREKNRQIDENLSIFPIIDPV